MDVRKVGEKTVYNVKSITDSDVSVCRNNAQDVQRLIPIKEISISWIRAGIKARMRHLDLHLT